MGGIIVEEVKYTVGLLDENGYDIPSAETVRKITKSAKEKKLNRNVITINQSIKSASCQGRNKIELNVDKEIFSQIQQLYKKAGYKVIARTIYDQKLTSITIDWSEEK